MTPNGGGGLGGAPDQLQRCQVQLLQLDTAVFDLKAVNPNAVLRIDTRTPDEVIKSISD